MIYKVPQLKHNVCQKYLDIRIFGYQLKLFRSLSTQILCLSKTVGYLDIWIPVREFQNFQKSDSVFTKTFGYLDNWIPVWNFQNLNSLLQKYLDIWIIGYHPDDLRSLLTQTKCLSKIFGYSDNWIPLRNFQKSIKSNSMSLKNSWIHGYLDTSKRFSEFSGIWFCF